MSVRVLGSQRAAALPLNLGSSSSRLSKKAGLPGLDVLAVATGEERDLSRRGRETWRRGSRGRVSMDLWGDEDCAVDAEGITTRPQSPEWFQHVF